MATHTKPAWRLAHRVRVSGGEVAAGVFGEGPPVVLVHGTPAWSYLWREVAPLLAREHTVHVWDLLGFGDSRPDPGVEPSIAQQARTLVELTEHWGLDSPSLVGHDIGGGIVLRAHLVEQLPVHRLALLDAAVLGPWNTPFTEHQQRHADVYRTMPPDIFGDVIAARFRTATHRPMSDDVAHAYLSPWAGAAGQQRWIDQVTAVSFEDTREVVDRLDKITAPTLVVWGEQDLWLEPATGDRLASSIPGAHQATVPEAGHFVAEDNPHDTADALLRFFS
ncbi:alpha/beta hydrolase [Streptomyces sp. Je 1-4]|uniref:alpha/beta fold hydrolase n=1 Tax=Streptomyces TaxID=1883 RepID=UPI0021D9F641|nr:MULTISPECIES: alpha/beta hydrolase [unclassified Streptomyces]UYB38169.1 alpha/beta hydrolase [Streptomyces sp. Je 1-4]UZQ34108.1 alpha/beta hydrolase [Streptomyces sp. Je 1-4] [Streptomyces sp. Je 1-4 4N24]UZQ41526.1 alpha/beta hydrolase [Streptomyces sp. Je 1-4] [Streptomyces sp. Je 1-4 4N24_ara]